MSRDHSQNHYGPNASFDGRDSDLAAAGILIESLRQQLSEAYEAGKRDASADLGQDAFEKWLYDKCPSGGVESVQRQWLESYEHAEFAGKMEQAAQIESLRQQLAAALAACKLKGEALQNCEGMLDELRDYPITHDATIEALAIQPDDSALTCYQEALEIAKKGLQHYENRNLAHNTRNPAAIALDEIAVKTERPAMKTPITTREAFSRLCEFKYLIAAIGICLVVGFCAPPPAHAEPRRQGDLYTRYPFQTPAQASRQLDLQAEQRRRDRAYEDQRQEDRRYDADQRALDRFERDLREIYR